MKYQKIELEQQNEYNRQLETSGYDASDYSFVNLWSWSDEYQLTWSWHSGLVWIRQETPEPAYWSPVGPWENVDWKPLLTDTFPRGAQFIRVPEPLSERWAQDLGDRVEIHESRGQWDYRYAVQDLIDLKGNRFHKKKNLLNQFRKKYDFQHRSFDSEIIKLACEMQQDWCTWRDCEASETLIAENRAIAQVLRNWDHLDGLHGGALMVDGTLIAYTIAEKLTEDTLVIHFEKGSHGYKGVYQAINQMFLEASGNGYTYVNREQDLGNEGLRKAKMSYNPVDFVKKSRVTLKPAA